MNAPHIFDGHASWMNMSDPREIIRHAPMRGAQTLAVGICIILNALDGFDVLAITYAAPGLREAWAIDAGALGWLISAGLIGMTLGSLFVAPIADIFGRRRVIILCLLVMFGGMLASALANSFELLFALRLATGIGIGGMVPAINAMVAEYSNARNRDLAVSLIAVGYPIGGVLGGLGAVWLLSHFTWPSVFWFGATATGVMIPIVILALPESIEFLMTRRPPSALARINATLQRMSHPMIDRLPEPEIQAARARLIDIFSREMIAKTSFLTLAYFFHMITFYYVLGWVPATVAALGFDQSAASSVSVLVSIGGIIGGLGLGFAARALSLRMLVVGSMLATTLTLSIFGFVPANLLAIQAAGLAVGFFVFAGVVGLYAFMVHAFPAHMRSTGTGFAIGMGRAGGALGPILAGGLIAYGIERPGVAVLLATGSALAAAAAWSLRVNIAKRPEHSPA